MLSRSLAQAEVDEVHVPGEKGSLGSLPGHTALLTHCGEGALLDRQGEVATNCGVPAISDRMVATPSRVITTGTLTFLLARTAWMRSSMVHQAPLCCA